MPTEIKPNGLPGERYDLSDIFSALPNSSHTKSIGDQFRRLQMWIESIGGTHVEIPVRRKMEYSGLVVKVEEYFSVQCIGRGDYITHINNRLDQKMSEGCMATVKIDVEGYGRVDVHPHHGNALGRGGR